MREIARGLDNRVGWREWCEDGRMEWSGRLRGLEGVGGVVL